MEFFSAIWGLNPIIKFVLLGLIFGFVLALFKKVIKFAILMAVLAILIIVILKLVDIM